LLYALDQRNRRASAYHEAGHVIAGAYFGRGTEYVQLGAFPHQCADAMAIDQMSPEAVEEMLVVQYLAGNVAGDIAR
jgi:ATP-dependent Zn protease